MYTYQISWLLEGRILNIVLEGDLGTASAAFMKDFDTEIKSCLDQSPAPVVHTVGDMRGVISLPDSRILHRVFTFPWHPRAGWHVLIGPEKNPSVKLIHTMMGEVFQAHCRQVPSLEAALAFLQKIDTSLPDLSGFAGAWTPVKEEVNEQGLS